MNEVQHASLTLRMRLRHVLSPPESDGWSWFQLFGIFGSAT